MLNKLYTPLLKDLSLTYPQYIVMLILWENNKPISVKNIGKKIDLDSGTLSPLLKRMEKLTLIKRIRSEDDERSVNIELTAHGKNIKLKAKHIPAKLFALTGLSKTEMHNLQNSLDKLIGQTKKHLN
ncbi:MAG: MarR family transcriptional regulator [Colwellia sp.]